MISFYISCEPPKSTHQASQRILKRNNGQMFIGKFANSKAKKAKDDFISMFTPYKPKKPLEGPLRLCVGWVYPWRKAETKRNKQNGIMHCDKRPDCDNLAKMIQDVLGDLKFYNDDGQIASLEFNKFWGDEPGISISLKELKQEDINND